MNRYLRIIVFASFSAGAVISIDACGLLTRLLPHKARVNQIMIDMVRVDNAVLMPDAAKEDANVVTITRDGALFLGQNKIPIDVLGKLLRDRLGDRPNPVMYLRADAHAKFRTVEDVIDSVRAAGVDDVGLLVRMKDEAAKKEHFTRGIPPETPRGLDIVTFSSPETRQLVPTRIPHDILTATRRSMGVAMPSHEDRTIVVQIFYRPGGVPIYKINETDVAKAELLPRLTDIYANRAERVLFIKGDDDLNFSDVAEVVDIAHSAEVDHPGVLTPHVLASQ
jgi:biopolymer transport protein ExbD